MGALMARETYGNHAKLTQYRGQRSQSQVGPWCAALLQAIPNPHPPNGNESGGEEKNAISN